MASLVAIVIMILEPTTKVAAVIAAVVIAKEDAHDGHGEHSPAQEKCHQAEIKAEKACSDKFGSKTATATCKKSKSKSCMADEDKK